MRKETNDNMDDLLVKYLLGEATMQERTAVEQWVAGNTINQRYFENFKLIWNRSKQLATHSEVDEDMAWLRFKDRVEEIQSPVLPMFSSQVFRIMRIAAAIAIVAGGGWFAYMISAKNNLQQQVAVHSGNKTRIETLPDGSVITLNKNSTITYAENFTAGDSREVVLTGEAFFEVTPDKSKPFLIHSDDVIVKVVGTSFNVKNTAEKTEVIVETGLVEVTKKEQKVRIRPEERVTVMKENIDLVKQKNDNRFYDYYRTKKLVCEGTPLWKLVQVLNEAYHVNITVSHEKMNLPINTTFDDKSLDEILNIVSVTFNITIVRDDGQIILK